VTFPPSPPPVPAVVSRFANGREVRAVWVNEDGGVTFRLGSAVPGAAGREFIKVANSGSTDFAGATRRLRWAGAYVTVPRLLGCGIADGGAWLRTAALPGRSAVHPRWLATPDVAVRAIGAGLRTLHDRLPVDRLVVCHGDACAPNTLVDDDGRSCGHVDFGQLGVADRWADLAVATLSLGWNYPGRDWEAEFFNAYGVQPDPARIDYYRRLWKAFDHTSDAASR
jgi:kanamycin kinase